MLFLCGCHYEIARPPKKRHVHIASDVLVAKDTILFTSLKKFKKIRVHIHHMTMDSLIEHLTNEGVNTYIDMVLLSSIEDGQRLENIGSLQRIHETERIPTALRMHLSESKQLLGIGMNPYVFLQSRTDSTQLNQYVDVWRGSKWKSCENARFIPFIAGTQYALKQQPYSKRIAWINRFFAAEILGKDTDSIHKNRLYFGRYSDCSTYLAASRVVRFPNQQLKGSYADMTVGGIIRQARNYSTAIELLSTLQFEPFIRAINQPFETFVPKGNTINYNGNRIQIYPISPMELYGNTKDCSQLIRKARKKNKKANL